MKVGLALGGGALRGIAHIGALSVLAESDIRFDCIAGCSAGSIVGALLAAGVSLEEMEDTLPLVRWRQFAHPVRSKWGVFSFDRLARWLIMMIGDQEFSELMVPFAVVVLDVTSGRRQVIRQGRVAPAVQASCSIPGIFTPVSIGDKLLVDGGVIDNLPVWATRQLGADFVVAVDVVTPNYSRAWGPVGKGLAAIETLVRHAGGGASAADFLIAPDTSGRSYVRFSDSRELLEAGRQAAKRAMPDLLRQLDISKAERKSDRDSP